MSAPLVLRPSEGTKLAAFDVELTFKATGATTGGAYSIVEGIWRPGGFAPLPHIHTEQEESFYVLEGNFHFHMGDETLVADPGTFIIVPRGVLHSFSAAGDAPGKLLFMHSPPLEGFFFELQELTSAGAEPSQIRELMGRWGMEAPVQ
jgi:mannose-6-phosphate isomerase-like protein (cupin superfamily)